MHLSRTVFTFFLSLALVTDAFTPSPKRNLYEPDYTNMKYANAAVDVNPHVNMHPVDTFPTPKGMSPYGPTSPFDEFKQTIIDAVYEKKSDEESEEKLKAAIENQKQLLSETHPSSRGKRTRVSAEDFVAKPEVLPPTNNMGMHSQMNPNGMGMPTFGLEQDQYFACGMHMMGPGMNMSGMPMGNGYGMHSMGMNMSGNYGNAYSSMNMEGGGYGTSYSNMYSSSSSYGSQMPGNNGGYAPHPQNIQRGYYESSSFSGYSGMQGGMGGGYMHMQGGMHEGMGGSYGQHPTSSSAYGSGGLSSAYHRTPLPQSVLGENGMGSSSRSYKSNGSYS
jgi:hypothetical protein